MKKYLKSYFESLSSLLFVKNNYVIGGVLFILSFIRPSSGILSLVAYTSAILFVKYTGLGRNNLVHGVYTYNSILTGIGIGFLFSVSPLSIAFTIIAGIFTLLISYALQNVFSYYFLLPILNVPFTIIIILIYLASVRYGNLFISQTIFASRFNLDFLPLWLSGLFKSAGVLVFLPYDIAGIAILLIILIYSRIAFFLSIAGYYTGTLFLYLLKGSAYYAFTDIYSFNFILIAISLGGVFLIPSVKSYFTALTGVLVSVLILDAVNVFWSSYSIPVFTMPYVFTTLPVLYVFITGGYKFVTRTFLGNPEQNLEFYLNYSMRFDQFLPQPHLPFSGEWKVYQGFNGEWTHKGSWAYGIDFVIENKMDNLTYKYDGFSLDDYYCFKKPVLAPVSGTVVAVCDEFKDNLIGIVEKNNPWGNHVIIESPWHYYVEISHFSEKSITVKVGDKVHLGQIIGKCGNSGYSPQPHIHFQIQHYPRPGAPSVPFRFIDSLHNNKYTGGTAVPEKNQFVKPLPVSRSIDRKLQLILDETFVFDFIENEKFIRSISLKVKMDENAAYYLSEKDDSARLYFSAMDGIFTFYQYTGSTRSPLKYFLIALPRFPLTEEQITWSDKLSALYFAKANGLYSLIRSFNHNMFSSDCTYKLDQDGFVRGEIDVKLLFKRIKCATIMVFNDYRFFDKIEIVQNNNTYTLKRKNI